MVLQPSMFYKKYPFVKVQRWFVAALDLRLWIQPIRWFSLLQGHRAHGRRIWLGKNFAEIVSFRSG